MSCCTSTFAVRPQDPPPLPPTASGRIRMSGSHNRNGVLGSEPTKHCPHPLPTQKTPKKSACRHCNDPTGTFHVQSRKTCKKECLRQRQTAAPESQNRHKQNADRARSKQGASYGDWLNCAQKQAKGEGAQNKSKQAHRMGVQISTRVMGQHSEKACMDSKTGRPRPRCKADGQAQAQDTGTCCASNKGNNVQLCALWRCSECSRKLGDCTMRITPSKKRANSTGIGTNRPDSKWAASANPLEVRVMCQSAHG